MQILWNVHMKKKLLAVQAKYCSKYFTNYWTSLDCKKIQIDEEISKFLQKFAWQQYWITD